MTQTHTIECITFPTPGDWTFEKQAGEIEVSAAIYGPGASFLTISLFRDRPAPADLIESAIDTFRAEYEELDVYPTEAKICDSPTEARDLDFVSLDQVGSVFLRSFSTQQFTVFILCQTDALELDDTRAIFDRLTAEMACDDDERPPGSVIPGQ